MTPQIPTDVSQHSHTSASNKSSNPILRVGIIGCGEIAQVSHIPIFNFLRHKYRITYLCDISQDALSHCSQMIVSGNSTGDSVITTTNAEDLCASNNIDVVLICNADEYHVEHGILALKHDKWCLIEKPLALCFKDIDALIEAERTSKGRVFVGTMRRFAPAFLEAVQEVGGMDRILYARVRSIIGPNSNFIEQSGTFPKYFTDVPSACIQDRKEKARVINHQALEKEFGVKVTDATIRQLRILGSLNTHDLSAMREIIGMPKTVLAASLGFPGIYTALFDYDKFAVTFESGINSVPTFDANIEIYSEDKIVKVQFDTPYVKGLPVTMIIREKIRSLPETSSFGFQERVVRRTYEDPYTLEFLELYDCVVNGKEIKTSTHDARNDLELYRMILKAGEHTYKKNDGCGQMGKL
ncbi:hypothetical protein PISL3812_03386 [Talaromyces islandicus]|uniref:Gfo/Idh/MocA-like oxidoreductase N-terminal domain-containing protein n=1 Tax=Talaromyces islandicus TaxID=28573 RepID=A0A0U1LUY1_TALIS|nr:hypothetical protein PISL3812_03386 [Talaromyces islandicus]